MGVGGGAWYPPAQGALADKAGTRRSYLVPASGYLAMLVYAAGLVIDQARTGGFRFRNVDEEIALHTAVAGGLPETAMATPAAVTGVLERQMWKKREEDDETSTKDNMTSEMIEKVA